MEEKDCKLCEHCTKIYMPISAWVPISGDNSFCFCELFNLPLDEIDNCTCEKRFDEQIKRSKKMEELKTFTPEWYKEQLKNVLNDLLERADEIVDTLVENQGTEAQISVSVRAMEIPTYTINQTYYSKKKPAEFENVRD